MVYKLRRVGSKYRAVRTEGFSSKLEHAVYQILLLRSKAGEITDIKQQVRFLLSRAEISWRVDFTYIANTGALVAVEAKGVETEAYRIKKKLWGVYGPCALEVWKGSWGKPVLWETIVPSRNL